MKVSFKAYLRRDGSWMIYLNNDRNVSVGISENGYPPSMKQTQGQKNLINAALKTFNKNAKEFTGDIDAHNEIKAICGPYTLLATDVCNIGGMVVGSDGGYIVRNGRILRCSEWFEVED